MKSSTRHKAIRWAIADCFFFMLPGIISQRHPRETFKKNNCKFQSSDLKTRLCPEAHFRSNLSKTGIGIFQKFAWLKAERRCKNNVQL